ncbi:MAG: hypothetical protein J07HX64_00236 [halophilic archaeon J07HX64]|nr:MAG: hypothetical protein J07HX64_00236 [halophilic archaeon J07HX64]
MSRSAAGYRQQFLSAGLGLHTGLRTAQTPRRAAPSESREAWVVRAETESVLSFFEERIPPFTAGRMSPSGGLSAHCSVSA